MDELKSEKIVLSSPLSFIGSARRIWRLTNVDNIAMRLLLIPVTVVLILCAWMFVAFGILLSTFSLESCLSRIDY